ncbi:RING-H2 finger protein [Vigna angularis]|uniref:RING-type E3 ubiquitin transferase n=1 Tax=Phaseolus angularis TaxID=3914 RepID=A0A8T0L2U5_PHAAN|nr:RING-H2 finger protein ATL16 [Vigna angularis]KAG2405891.1 RING-H2 finger protein [Vigna angularis]
MALNPIPSYKLLPPIKTHASTILHKPKPPSNSASALPILAIIVPTIFVTVFILITYLTLVTKCFSNLYLFHPLRWFFSLLTPQHEDQDPSIALSPRMWSQGLDESAIKEIPTLQFTKGDVEKNHQSVLYGCVICLTEFQDHDMLKVLPICKHAFHFHCIDVWLQTNSNCPLCRSSIVSGNTDCPMDHIIAPSSSPQDSQLLSYVDSDEDFVVIELEGEHGEALPQMTQQERSDSRERVVESRSHSIIRKCHHVSIMGDECIDVRKKDEQFSIQPIRRSFSMDSANDRQVYLDFQTIMQQNNRHLKSG